MASRRERGFTLVEIANVALIVGILAMLSVTSIQNIFLRARAVAFRNDARVFANAFDRYALQNGDYPPDSKGKDSFPPEMAGYINESQWTRITPLGGYYSWDHKTNNGKGQGAQKQIAITVNNTDLTMAQLLQVDRWIDDGDLGTGDVVAANSGKTLSYVVQPGK